MGRVSNEQESAAEQQPVLHLHAQPEGSRGRGTGHGTGSTRCTARLTAAFGTALQRGGNSPALEEGQREELWKMLQSAGFYLKHRGFVVMRVFPGTPWAGRALAQPWEFL